MCNLLIDVEPSEQSAFVRCLFCWLSPFGLVGLVLWLMVNQKSLATVEGNQTNQQSKSFPKFGHGCTWQSIKQRYLREGRVTLRLVTWSHRQRR